MKKNLFTMSFQEYMDYMFDHTASDGSILLPVQVNLVGDEEASRFTVLWNEKDVARVKAEFTEHVQNIRESAALGVEPNDTPEEARAKLVTRPDLYVFWRTYIKNIHTAVRPDPQDMFDVEERLSDIENAHFLATKLYQEKGLSEEDGEMLSMLAKVSVTSEEAQALKKFTKELREEANRRLPDARIGAYEMIASSGKLCAMLALEVPTAIENYAINQLAMFYVMTKFGIAANRTGIRMPDLVDTKPENNSERVVKTNSRKSLIPIFVLEILREKSNPLCPITQTRIAQILSEYPYEISVERSALGRVIASMAQENMGIHKCSKGVYFEKGSK